MGIEIKILLPVGLHVGLPAPIKWATNLPGTKAD